MLGAQTEPGIHTILPAQNAAPRRSALPRSAQPIAVAECEQSVFHDLCPF